VKFETEESEIARLRQEQAKAREDAVFGGLLPEEWARYEARANRIRELENVSANGTGAQTE